MAGRFCSNLSQPDMPCNKPWQRQIAFRRRLAMENIYADIAARADGNICIGVVVPVQIPL